MAELVSIIIPVYNCEQYLLRNLETVTGQSYKNLEIIYIDDGSSDQSAEMIRAFMKKDPRIKLICQTNHGVSYARNEGLKAATGTLITFADSDDYLDSRYVETMASDILEEQADIACCGLVLHRSDRDIPLHATGEKLVWDAVSAQKQFILGEYLEPGVTLKMFRREIVEGVFFPVGVKYTEDYLWAMKAFCNCKKAVFRGEGNYHYIIHPNSATTNAPIVKRAQDMIYVSETTASFPVAEEIRNLLEKKRLIGYLLNYNSLIYGKGEEVKALMNEIRGKILKEKEKYSQLGMTKREQFFFYGITLCPGLYRYQYRLLKRILPNRQTFR